MAKNSCLGAVDVPVVSDKVYQEPQSPTDRHAPGYDNDVKPNWLRGMGNGEATGKPSFDSGPSGSRYGK